SDVDLEMPGVAPPRRRPGQEDKVVQHTPMHMLLDPGSKLTDQQLRSIAFWEDRLVQTAVRYERLNEENDRRPGDQRVSLVSSVKGLESLESCRTSGIDNRVADLQKDRSVRVATAAGLLLAKWKLPVERGRYLPLLASDD